MLVKDKADKYQVNMAGTAASVWNVADGVCIGCCSRSKTASTEAGGNGDS